MKPDVVSFYTVSDMQKHFPLLCFSLRKPNVNVFASFSFYSKTIHATYIHLKLNKRAFATQANKWVFEFQPRQTKSLKQIVTASLPNARQ